MDCREEWDQQAERTVLFVCGKVNCRGGETTSGLIHLLVCLSIESVGNAKGLGD